MRAPFSLWKLCQSQSVDLFIQNTTVVLVEQFTLSSYLPSSNTGPRGASILIHKNT
jgi:hypothetical protein